MDKKFFIILSDLEYEAHLARSRTMGIFKVMAEGQIEIMSAAF